CRGWLSSGTCSPISPMPTSTHESGTSRNITPTSPPRTAGASLRRRAPHKVRRYEKVSDQSMSQMQAQLQMQSTAIGGMRQAQALGYWQRAFRHLRQDKVTVFAFFLLLIITLLSVGAGVIGQAMDLDPNKTNLLTRMKPPSREHWLGTDDVGRDVFIRLLYAGRVSLLVGVLSAATAFVIGVSLGLLSGFYGRWVDDSVNALIQTTINIPLLFLLILLSVIFRPGVAGLAVIIGLFSWQNNARQIRAAVLSQKERDFVDAARVLGSGD